MIFHFSPHDCHGPQQRATQLGSAFSCKIKSVMAGAVPAIHFPEADEVLHRFWKMDGRHEGGHDEFGLDMGEKTSPGWPAFAGHDNFGIA